MFFFEKKNQKTFAHCIAPAAKRVSKKSKAVCFFFQKRSAFFLN